MMKRSATGRPSAAKAAVLIFAAAALALSCRALPLLPDAAAELADLSAVRSLPPSAAFHALIRPALLPALMEEAFSSLDRDSADTARRLAERTRTVYAALDPAEGGSPAAYYAILSGNYGTFSINAALGSAKGAKQMGGWTALPNGLKIALPSRRHILVTNADMESFLARYRDPSGRIEEAARGDGGGADHPAAQLVAPAPSETEGHWLGLRLLNADPGRLVLPAFLEGVLELPLERIDIEVREEAAALSVTARFGFDSENSARIFLPAVRMLGAAALKAAGSDVKAAQAAREGKTDSLSGIAMTPAAGAALILRMAGKKE